MLHSWFHILALVPLVVSAESQPNSGSCPLIDVEVATVNDVNACVQSLKTQSPTKYCDLSSNKAACKLDFSDCGQTNATYSLLCVWRNCFDSCMVMSNEQDTCVETCFGGNGDCDSSESVPEMIDCHVKLAKMKARVGKDKIICPLLTKHMSAFEFDDCLRNFININLERKCQRLGSACKYTDMAHCKNSIRNHWFDTRLLCVVSSCNHICEEALSPFSCRKECIGQDACKGKKGEDLILCYIEASNKFWLEHLPFVPKVKEPISHDIRKLADCSILLTKFSSNDDVETMRGTLTDCIHMMITMNMDEYCKVYIEECQEFPDDCNQAKPKKMLYFREVQKYQVDTNLACLGHKCSKACSEKWKENPSMVLKCKMNCIGNIENCSMGKSTLEILKCHIDHAAIFIEEGQINESSAENEEKPELGNDKKSTVGKVETSRAGNGQESQAENGQKLKVQASIGIWSVLLFKALGLIFNDSMF